MYKELFLPSRLMLTAMISYDLSSSEQKHDSSTPLLSSWIVNEIHVLKWRQVHLRYRHSKGQNNVGLRSTQPYNVRNYSCQDASMLTSMISYDASSSEEKHDSSAPLPASWVEQGVHPNERVHRPAVSLNSEKPPLVAVGQSTANNNKGRLYLPKKLGR